MKMRPERFRRFECFTGAEAGAAAAEGGSKAAAGGAAAGEGAAAGGAAAGGAEAAGVGAADYAAGAAGADSAWGASTLGNMGMTYEQFLASVGAGAGGGVAAGTMTGEGGGGSYGSTYQPGDYGYGDGEGYINPDSGAATQAPAPVTDIAPPPPSSGLTIPDIGNTVAGLTGSGAAGELAGAASTANTIAGAASNAESILDPQTGGPAASGTSVSTGGVDPQTTRLIEQMRVQQEAQVKATALQRFDNMSNAGTPGDGSIGGSGGGGPGGETDFSGGGDGSDATGSGASTADTVAAEQEFAKLAKGVTSGTTSIQSALDALTKYGPLGLALGNLLQNKSALSAASKFAGAGVNGTASQLSQVGAPQAATGKSILDSFNAGKLDPITPVPTAPGGAPLGTAQGSVGNQIIKQFQEGTLNPADTAAIDQWEKESIAQMRQFYANAHLSDSTQAVQAESQIREKAVAMKAQARQNLLTTGLNAANAGDRTQQTTFQQSEQARQQLLQTGLSSLNVTDANQRGAIQAEINADAQTRAAASKFMDSYGAWLANLPKLTKAAAEV